MLITKGFVEGALISVFGDFDLDFSFLVGVLLALFDVDFFCSRVVLGLRPFLEVAGRESVISSVWPLPD